MPQTANQRTREIVRAALSTPSGNPEDRTSP
jgi:hypothetical protein